MDLLYVRTGRVYNIRMYLLKLLVIRLRYPVRANDHGRTVRYILDRVYAADAFFGQIVRQIAIMYQHSIRDRAVSGILRMFIRNLDRPVYAETKSGFFCDLYLHCYSPDVNFLLYSSYVGMFASLPISGISISSVILLSSFESGLVPK